MIVKMINYLITINSKSKYGYILPVKFAYNGKLQ